MFRARALGAAGGLRFQRRTKTWLFPPLPEMEPIRRANDRGRLPEGGYKQTVNRSSTLCQIHVTGKTREPHRGSHASARFILLIASSISCVFLKPIVAQSTPACWKANLIAFTRSS